MQIDLLETCPRRSRIEFQFLPEHVDYKIINGKRYLNNPVLVSSTLVKKLRTYQLIEVWRYQLDEDNWNADERYEYEDEWHFDEPYEDDWDADEFYEDGDEDDWNPDERYAYDGNKSLDIVTWVHFANFVFLVTYVCCSSP